MCDILLDYTYTECSINYRKSKRNIIILLSKYMVRKKSDIIVIRIKHFLNKIFILIKFYS